MNTDSYTNLDESNIIQGKTILGVDGAVVTEDKITNVSITPTLPTQEPEE